MLVSTVFLNDSQIAGVHGSHHIVSMFAEKIPARLTGVRVPYPDVLHLYRAALLGFERLYQKVGGFQVNEEMVGVNQDGKVKVWMNPEWSNDRPANQLQRG